jgi:hypothetical protein
VRQEINLQDRPRAPPRGVPRREGGGARGAERLGARPHQLRPATAAHTQRRSPFAPVVAGYTHGPQRPEMGNKCAFSVPESPF